MSIPKYETLTGEWIADGVFHLQLNRVDKFNAMNPQFFAELPLCINYLNNQPNLKVIMISGNGKHFSSGLDL
jgi:enoyl-CoA hydratase/carnithine racemase